MAPALWQRQFIHAIAPTPANGSETRGGFDWRLYASAEDLILESWSQGFVVGSILIMLCITLANMRRHILLHKLIFLEQLMALTHGTFCFMDFNGYGWYLSSTAALLYLSYILHNVIAWMKVRPFFYGSGTIFEPKFVKWTTKIYVYGLACTVPIIMFQITNNFRFFNGYGGWYSPVRPYEPLMRDPWWIFCSGILFHVISRSYGMNVRRIIKKSPRFGILFVAIILALVFTALDVAASITPFIGGTLGINPWWKLSLVFKLLTDAILLDDFKTELRRLGLKRLEKDEMRRGSVALTLDDDDFRYDSDENAERNHSSPMLSRSQTAGTAKNGLNCSVNGHIKGYQQAYKFSQGDQKNKSVELGNSEQIEFMQALSDTDSSDIGKGRSSQHQQGRAQVGRGGTRVTKLPTFFESIRPAKRQKKDSASTANTDTSEQPPFSERNNIHSWSRTTSGTQMMDEEELAPDDIGVRIEDQSPAMPSAMSISKQQTPGSEIVVEDGGLEQAIRTNEATIRELRARKDSATLYAFNEIGDIEIGGGKGKGNHNQNPDDHTHSRSNSNTITVRRQSLQGLSNDLQTQQSVVGKDKGKARREWWDQLEGDIECLDSVDRVEDVETKPCVPSGSGTW